MTATGTAVAPARATKQVCPSYRCVEDAFLLGIVQSDGVVAFATTPFRITQDFIEVAAQGDQPERRFRFAGPCHANRCAQWKDGRCSIPGQVRERLRDHQAEAPAHCAIRAGCRWFAQESYSACKLCPLVTTYSGSPAAQ